MTASLVINADDLGLSAGINRAIERAHRDGVVRSTSLLAVGRHYDDAVRMLQRNPGLRVGAHLAIVGEDPPLLSAREVPTLVDRDGRFPLTYRTVVARGIRRALDPDDVRRELGAQIERLQGSGLELTHLDTHQHTHLWPSVGTVVLQLAQQHGIGVVRRPRAHERAPVAVGVNVLSALLGRRLARGGFAAPDYAGLDHAGHMSEARLVEQIGVLARRRGRSRRPAEINMHPGYVDEDSARFDWGYEWMAELDALCSPRVASTITAHGYRVSDFALLGTERG